MIWVAQFFRYISLKIVLKINKTDFQIKKILPLINFPFIKKNKNELNYNFTYNLEMQKYLKLAAISWLINCFLAAFCDLFLTIIITFIFLYFLGYLSSAQIIPHSFLIATILEILSLIRVNSDALKMSIRGKWIYNWRFIFLIIDILTLNFLAILAFLKAKNSKDYLQEVKININNKGISTYQKINRQYILICIIFLLLFFIISAIFLIIHFYYLNNNIIDYIILIFIVLSVIGLLVFLTFELPALIISNILINKIENSDIINLPECFSLIKYIAIAINPITAAVFIQQLNLHQILLDNNLYKNI